MSSGDQNSAQQQRKEDEDDTVDAEPVPQRPVRPTTARTRPAHQRLNDPYPQFDNEIDEDRLGAVGGAPRSYAQSIISEDERRVGHQARQLLEMFIDDRAEREHIPDEQRNILRSGVFQHGRKEVNTSEDNLTEVARSLQIIGDQLAEDIELNRLINLVPVDSPKITFMRVCEKVFMDQQFNWGRVVALFYFAYRLIAKAVRTSLQQAIPWMQELMTWAMDFFTQYVANWIIARGGWKMIVEWFGMSGRNFYVLFAFSILVGLYWMKK